MLAAFVAVTLTTIRGMMMMTVVIIWMSSIDSILHEVDGEHRGHTFTFVSSRLGLHRDEKITAISIDSI